MFVRNKCYEYIYLIRSQAHNEFFSCDYLIDVLLAPFFHIADSSKSWLGVSLVICIFILTCLVVTFAYVIGVPYYWSMNPFMCLCLIVVGHWILINVLFNLYKAIVTKPGYPTLSQKLISVCKKCFVSKPPRAHHCSVCNRCILKMDHHCPWINNCVGFYNHRYFFFYMVYLLIGVIFLTVFGFNIAWKLIFEDGQENDNIYGYSVNETNISTLDDITDEFFFHTLPHFKKLISYVALIVLSALASMIYFVYWHAKLITQGQTIIEYYINCKESKQCQILNKPFRNPYDFGPIMNWKLFLGVKNNESIFRQILFPCEYRPNGDGIHWLTVFSKENIYSND